jgi:hypothetical protein
MRSVIVIAIFHAALQDKQTEYWRATLLISPYRRVTKRYTPSISKASYPLQASGIFALLRIRNIKGVNARNAPARRAIHDLASHTNTALRRIRCYLSTTTVANE